MELLHALYANMTQTAMPHVYYDILAQGFIGLIGYSYQQVVTSFPGTHSKGTLG
jgi:hypothetical protein